MPCYISSNQNRFYAAVENDFGSVASVTAANRIPAIKLAIQHDTISARRRDKSGSRSRAAMPTGVRRKTDYRLETYLTNWGETAGEPAYGPLLRGALGAAPVIATGGIVASTSGNNITVGGPHGLATGQAISFGSEIRFVETVVNETTIRLNAPFSVLPATGAPLNPTITYAPATQLPSVSIFDYWSPATAVQRIVAGASVDVMKIKVNGDYHEFEFQGEARDLLDNTSFSSGVAALTQFPEEPAVSEIGYQIIPGHIGQVWMGASPTQFFTLTDAEVVVRNNVDMRKREFGFDGPRCLSAGEREVGMRFRILEQDDAATKDLYAAGKARQPISVMLQLGQEPGQLCGIYMPNVIPEVPEFDDRNPRVEWAFGLSQANGSLDDEIRIAFA